MKIELFLKVIFLLLIVSVLYAQQILIKELAFCPEIKNNEPVNPSDRFTKNIGKIYLWMKIETQKVPVNITHVWYYEDKKMAENPIQISNKITRVWSYKIIKPEWTGIWTCEVVGPNKNIILRAEFLIMDENENEEKSLPSTNITKTIKKIFFPKNEIQKISDTEFINDTTQYEPGIGLRIEMKFGTDIINREIAGESTEFKGGKIYCWTLVEGASSNTSIVHVWYYGNKKVSEIPLEILKIRARTWSYQTIPSQNKGTWTVKILDTTGRELKQASFKIK